MKLTRIAALPFAVFADVCTLGNIGSPEGSFTQQMFDAERAEQERRDILEAMRIALNHNRDRA